MEGSVVLLLLETFLFIILSLALGVLISTKAQTQQVALMLSLFALMLPTILLSGFIFPVENMPLPLRVIANVQGLQPEGDTSFSETFGSGPPLTAEPGSTNLGLIQSGALEQANVELTKELVDMIQAQRAFQANAQVISTAEEVTQTVINIGR